MGIYSLILVSMHTDPLWQEVASSQPDVALAHVFVDEPYNRINLTLASEHGNAVCRARAGTLATRGRILALTLWLSVTLFAKNNAALSRPCQSVPLPRSSS